MSAPIVRFVTPVLWLLAVAACSASSDPTPHTAPQTPAADVEPDAPTPSDAVEDVDDVVSGDLAVPADPADPADPAVHGEPPDVYAPLVQALRELSSDPDPASTTKGKHYLVSNERRLDLFRPDIDGLGGIHLGVGTDQNFLMAAWSRPEVMIIVDFDAEVVDLWKVHAAFFRASDDVDAYLRLWSAEGHDDALALLRELPPGPERKRVIAQFERTRQEVDDRFRKLAERYEELSIHSYLDTPSEYDFVRSMFTRDRIVVLRGDYTKPGVVRQIGDVLREHDQPVQVLYLSNVEQYVSYRKPFRENMLGLPFADDTLVLRTLPGRPAGFQYMLQRGEDFRTWMRAKGVWSVYRLRGKVKGEHLVASERYFIERLPGDPETLGGAGKARTIK